MLESKAWRKGAGKQDLEEWYWKARLGERALESEVWRKGAEARLGGRTPESEAWIKGTGKQGLDEGCRKARLG